MSEAVQKSQNIAVLGVGITGLTAAKELIDH